MKKIILLSGILFTFLVQSCVFSDWDNGNSGWGRGISGNGNVITEVIDVDGFTGVKASAGIDVNLSQGNFSVEVVADENLQEYITVELKGDMLVVGSERNIYRAESKVVNVTLPELTAIRISSAGDIDAETDFTCKDLTIDISSAGDLKMGVRAESIDISISSSGDCKIWGKTEDLRASLSSAGDLAAYDLEADYVKVRVSSAGDARVMANKEIDMGASSAGSIYYKGEAIVIHSSTSSAGSIVHRD